MELKINKIKFSKSNQRIDFDYTYSKDISRYFSKQKFFVEYEEDISSIPFEILAIPFLANLMPIAWFANFRVKIDKIDENFLFALKDLKQEFSKWYELSSLDDCMLDYNEIISSPISQGTKEAMLFSGGLDAYTTYLRHQSNNLNLITINGADIKLNDHKQWLDLQNYLKTTDLISENIKFNIHSNIRDFYSFEVNKLLPNLGWWGKIQHGLALTCLAAPICFKHDIKTLYIASTRSDKMEFSPWGSMPETDNLIKWAFTKIIHDGYELTRFDKAVNVLNKSANFNHKPLLRVCYNEYKSTLNCNKCEKCVRMIFAILINGKNPNDYGFVVDENIYNRIMQVLENGFSTDGTKMYWLEMRDNYIDNQLFIFKNKEEEIELVNSIIKQINQVSKKQINTVSKLSKLKLALISKNPKLFENYLKIRRKFL